MLISEVPALREYFYPVAYAADVTDQPMACMLFGETYVLWRSRPDGPVLAAADQCPHRGAQLSQGWITDGCLVCPYHGWRFAEGGGCTRIPQNPPELPIPPRARLLPILAEERYGLVWMCVGMPRAGVPELPRADEPDFELHHEFLEEWDTCAFRVMDNSLDNAHVSFVHRGTIGDIDNPLLPPFRVERHEHGLRFDLSYVSRADEQQQRNLGISEPLVERKMHYDLVQPMVHTVVINYPNGVVHVLYKGASPIDDERSLFFQFIARNDQPGDRWDSIVAVERAVTLEDKPILSAMPADFPLEVTTELHTRCDRMTVEYRRLLAELAAEAPVAPRPDREWARQL